MPTAYPLEFVSDFWVDPHHVLYAAAWARRGNPRGMAGALPTPLNCADKKWLAASITTTAISPIGICCSTRKCATSERR